MNDFEKIEKAYGAKIEGAEMLDKELTGGRKMLFLMLDNGQHLEMVFANQAEVDEYMMKLRNWWKK